MSAAATLSSEGACSQGQQRAYFDKLWLDLSKGISEMFKDRAGLIYFADLYKIVVDYCTCKRGTVDPRRLVGTHRSMGHELYDRLGEFLRNYLVTRFSDGTELKSGDLLRSYIKEWEDYKQSSSKLDNVFLFFKLQWVQRERREGRTNVYDPYQLAVVCWRDCVFKALRVHLTAALLKLVREERNGESIDIKLVSRVILSYVEVGVNEDASSNVANLTEYQTAFESSFLLETYSFYKNESADFINRNSVADYMKKVEQRLGEEEQRVKLYLYDTTAMPLQHQCNRALIHDHQKILRAEFKKLLHEDKVEDLKRMFQLVSRVEGGLDLTTVFEKHVRAKGLSAIEKLREEDAMDPQLYISVMVQVHCEGKKQVIETFDNNRGLVDALDKACVSFVNSNAVTNFNKSPRKSPETLARYCDALLTESAAIPEESDLEDLLDQVMVLFKYVKSKDIFHKFYAKLLARRLVDHTSASDDAEARMVMRLYVACGPDYVRALQRMLQDIKVSKGVNEEFRKFLLARKEARSFEFNINVLTTGSWPFHESILFQLPEVLKHVVQSFTVFYCDRHTGRKLQWLYNQSCGELVVNCFAAQYVLEVSTCQMAVLLLYNFVDSFTVRQLKEETGIDMARLRDVLRSLLESEILVSEGWPSEESAVLNPDTQVTLSKHYSSKKVRVNIKGLLKSEVETEQVADQRQIEDERRFSVQAAIVRIMKANMKLKYEELLTEVTRQLSGLFTPSERIVKSCVKTLIDKEYLKRGEDGQMDTYTYII